MTTSTPEGRKVDREAVARIVDPDAFLSAEEWAVNYPGHNRRSYDPAPEAPHQSSRAIALAKADAILAGWRGQAERLKFVPRGDPGSYQRGYDNGWNAALSALLNAGQAVPGWRTLDSAPRDGTPILACWLLPDRGPLYGVVAWGTAVYGDDLMTAGDEKGWLENDRFVSDPTHWKPTPEPPAMLNAAPPVGEGEE